MTDTPDAWAIMDEWLKKQSDAVATKAGAHIIGGGDLNKPSYRTLLGRGQAYARMRSFIHGAKND